MLSCIILVYVFTFTLNNVDSLRGPCSFDTVVRWVGDNKTYFFKGKMYARMIEKVGLEETAPISNWRGIPDNLDAATTWKGTNYFFKGCHYWRYYKNGQSDGPHNISAWGVPCNLDAAVTFEGSTYLFKSGYYWRRGNNDFSGPHYVKRNWYGGLKGNIDAALVRKGKIYFLKGRILVIFEKPGKFPDSVSGVGSKLLESQLLPDCPCDCNSCCNKNWQFDNIKYQLEEAKISPLLPEVIGHKTVDNRNGSGTPKITFTVSKVVMETKLLIHTAGAAAPFDVWFAANAPFIPEGKVIVEMDGFHHHFYYGRQVLSRRLRDASHSCPAMAKAKTVCTVYLHYRKIEVPYTIVWKHKGRGCTCNSKGIFTGVSSTFTTLRILHDIF